MTNNLLIQNIILFCYFSIHTDIFQFLIIRQCIEHSPFFPIRISLQTKRIAILL